MEREARFRVFQRRVIVWQWRRKSAGSARGVGVTENLVMKRFDRITVNPARQNGQPCIRDMRLTVRRVLEVLVIYPDRQELKREYPELEDADIRQALEYAAASWPMRKSN